jgi:hypothetical protein
MNIAIDRTIFEQGDVDARRAGRLAARRAWAKAMIYFDGTA